MKQCSVDGTGREDVSACDWLGSEDFDEAFAQPQRSAVAGFGFNQDVQHFVQEGSAGMNLVHLDNGLRL